MNSRGILIIVLSQSLICFAQTSTPPPIAAPSDVASPPSEQSSPSRAESNAIVPGKLIREEDPIYPKEAQKQKLKGTVTLVVTIEENGNVRNAAITSGNRILGEATLKAAHKWRFEPYTQHGRAISVWQNLAFDFAPGQKTARLESPLPEPTPVPRPITMFPSSATNLIFRVGGGVSAPRVLYMHDPEYTDEARREKVDGTCTLVLIVGPDGLPRNMRVVQSLGMGLDEKAIEAVKQWRFLPAMKDGQPVAVEISVLVQFNL
jgi:TonB family protein